jgi:hypothetical protein
MSGPIKAGRGFLLLFAFSALVNGGGLLLAPPPADPAKLDPDAREYFDLAGRILDGTYEFDSRRVLGHVAILAFFRLFTGANLVALQALVTMVFSLSAPMAYLLARRFVTQGPVALAVGVATALWPLFVTYGRTLYSETTALPVFLAFLSLLPVAPARPSRWVASGALLGACMLIRPMYLLFLPFVPFVLRFETGDSGRTARAVAWIGLGCALALAPWSVYASVEAGRPLLLSTNGGENLAGGYNPRLIEEGYRFWTAPDGRRTWVGPGKWLAEEQTGYLTEDEQKLPRFERERRLSERSAAWIVANPGPALYLVLAKLSYMWGVYPFWNGLAQTLFGNIPILLVELGAVLALVRIRRARDRLARLWMLPLFTSAVALVSWGSWRFREPADVGLITLSIFFLWSRLAPTTASLEPERPGRREEAVPSVALT